MSALDDAMFGALVATGEKVKTQQGVRAVVLSLCAGLDTPNFGEMASGTHRVNLERITGSNTATARTPGGANRAPQAVMVWREIPVPVIAAVHSVACGGGFQLCLGAEMRFVAPDAQLSVMEITWGLVPDMAGIVLMRGRFSLKAPLLDGPNRASFLRLRPLKYIGDWGCRMSGVVVRFERRVASLAVITKLTELGYLQPGARHRATAVERAIDRLRSDLVRQGVICDSNLSSSPKDEDQQGLLGTQIDERGPRLVHVRAPHSPRPG